MRPIANSIKVQCNWTRLKKIFKIFATVWKLHIMSILCESRHCGRYLLCGVRRPSKCVNNRSCSSSNRPEAQGYVYKMLWKLNSSLLSPPHTYLVVWREAQETLRRLFFYKLTDSPYHSQEKDVVLDFGAEVQELILR